MKTADCRMREPQRLKRVESGDENFIVFFGRARLDGWLVAFRSRDQRTRIVSGPRSLEPETRKEIIGGVNEFADGPNEHTQARPRFHTAGR